MAGADRAASKRNILLGVSCVLAFSGAARAQEPAPKPETPSSIAASKDQADRMTVPIMIDGKGPFDFVIDTGADRTVLSRELAARLALPPGPAAAVHATSGVEVEQTAIVDTLLVGGRKIRNIQAPLLARGDLGADGMLGIDSLRDQTMIMDFKGHRLLVAKSDPVADDRRTIVVHARSRYGELILVDASISGVPIYVILDSGAQNTIANTTLRRMLATRRRDEGLDLNVQVLSVTGGATAAEFRIVPTATLGDATLHNLPVAFADLHTFAQFDLTDRPAMLLGMDVLRIFDRVSVNFRRREVSFHMHES